MTPDRIALGVALLLLAATGMVVVRGVPEARVAPPVAIPDAPPAPEHPWAAVPLEKVGELAWGTVVPGRGTEPRDGQLVEVSWTGWLAATDEKVMLADHERLELGPDAVLPGIHQALLAMRPGETRQLHLPPALGFGQTGRLPTIPRDAPLVVEVTLHGVEEVRPVPEMPAAAATLEEDGLRQAILVEGSGSPPRAGDTVALHVTTWLEDGTLVSSTLSHHRPVRAKVGIGELMPGVDRVAVKLAVGEVRKVVVPPSLGFGDAGMGPVPPGATLIVQVERVSIQ
ncbi:MAG: FKBP-type peptidyl-prolyl cis-trans isomerase [Myxococcales bacterium]|nr:FKBP-type peptidyl-prolyl cis-trans isomerase [Myxococcales bacterium]MCB9672307.1 FKBP-type peptidyl-prolyl cis-trans isomerase [Alphaproteobacteria bacterium]MCB9692693.1 FKBP-type peptidyl-prolyl cis-trans isomerase [Alphaproteobacteria bacterium]